MSPIVEVVRDLDGNLSAIRRTELLPVVPAEIYKELLPLKDRRRDWGTIQVKLLQENQLSIVGCPYLEKVSTTEGLEMQILQDLAGIHQEVAGRLNTLHELVGDLQAILRLWPDLITVAVRKGMEPLVEHVRGLDNEVGNTTSRLNAEMVLTNRMHEELANHRKALTDHLEGPWLARPPNLAAEARTPEAHEEQMQDAAREQAEDRYRELQARVAPQGGSRLLSPMFGFARRLVGRR